MLQAAHLGLTLEATIAHPESATLAYLLRGRGRLVLVFRGSAHLAVTRSC